MHNLHFLRPPSIPDARELLLVILRRTSNRTYASKFQVNASSSIWAISMERSARNARNTVSNYLIEPRYRYRAAIVSLSAVINCAFYRVEYFSSTRLVD